jgi:chitinase
MGYYTGYEARALPAERIDFSLMTHLAISRAVPRNDGSLDLRMDYGPEAQAIEWAKGAQSLAHRAGRKVILMVGGEGTRDGWVAASKKNLPAFADNLLAAAKTIGADGLDLDWEPMTTEDEPLVVELAKVLRSKAPGNLLTVPIEWHPKTRAFYGDLAKHVDQINLMTYVMAGNWPSWKSWHSSALRGDSAETPSSVEAAVRALRAAQVPAAKIGVGAGFYGQCWQGVSGPRQVLTPNAKVVASDGKLTFPAILAEYEARAGKQAGKHDAAVQWDDEAHVPYMSFSAPTGPQQCTFLSYENVRSVSEKADYARREGLGGMIVWTLAQGYVPVSVPGAAKPDLPAGVQTAHPLLWAMTSRFFAAR